MNLRTGAARLSLLAFVALASANAWAQEVRLSDAEVKQLMEKLDKSRDRFEDALDGTLKRSIIRGPRVEVNVGQFLDDLQNDVKGLKDRYKPNYAASQEVQKVLRAGTDIEQFISSRPADFKGRSEWDTMAADLRGLAAAYGTTFPMPADAAVRRMTDGEVATTADRVANDAKAFKDQAKKAMRSAKADPAAIRAMERESDALGQAAKAVKSRVRGNKPATAEARQLFERAEALAAATQPNNLGGQATAAWRTLAGSLDKLSQAFGRSASSM